MAAAENPLPTIGAVRRDSPGSHELVIKESSNELFFAVVGHAGSGTSLVAIALQDLLRDMTVGPNKVDVEIVKARTVIEDWARAEGLPVPPPQPTRKLEDVSLLQDYGDKMRAEICNGQSDHAAVARRIVFQIVKLRAQKVGVTFTGKVAVKPDGKPRAYIIDATSEFLKRNKNRVLPLQI